MSIINQSDLSYHQILSESYKPFMRHVKWIGYGFESQVSPCLGDAEKQRWQGTVVSPSEEAWPHTLHSLLRESALSGPQYSVLDGTKK